MLCVSCQEDQSSDASSTDDQTESQSTTEQTEDEQIVSQEEREEIIDAGTENSLEEEIVTTPPINFMALTENGDVVEFVDIERYMGTWYEIATTPSIQQRLCYGTTANYSFNEAEGWVEVVNQCSVGSLEGRSQEIMGRAEVFDQDTQAKLEVFFFDQGSPYWVVELDGSEGDLPYQWAVVSVPNKQTIWILSRTPQMSPDIRQAIEQSLIDRAFPTELLKNTPQPELP